MYVTYNNTCVSCVVEFSAGRPGQITRKALDIILYLIPEFSGLKGNVKIIWLQPPYSAAGCSKII